uniref:Uncharacterized protein n=1 Tax=Salix viminalis TaxID=40686 RepID=A0A6N2K3Q1_SALVM
MEIFATSTPLGTASSSKRTLCGNPALFLKTIFSPAGTEKVLGTKAKDPSSLPSKMSMAMALLAIIALAAVATTAAPTSFIEALMLSLGSGEAETLALALALAAVAALRPVKDGMETAAEVTVAILELFCPGFCWSCWCCVLRAINQKEKGAYLVLIAMECECEAESWMCDWIMYGEVIGQRNWVISEDCSHWLAQMLFPDVALD